MRALKSLLGFVTWRWTPCIALIASSLLYVLIVLLVTPKTLAFGQTSKIVNVIEDTEPTNALMPARTQPTPTPAAQRGPAPRLGNAPSQPPMLQITPMAPPPPPEPHNDPPPPPPAPPPAPEPAEEEEAAPAPPPAPLSNPNARFMGTPLRFIPQIANAASAAAAASAAPAPNEEH